MFVYETTTKDSSNHDVEALAILFTDKQIPGTPDVLVYKDGENPKVKIGSTTYPVG